MGADVNACEGDGWTALHMACFYGYTNIVQTLLSGGADSTLKTKGGHTPADIAVESGHDEAADILSQVSAGGDPGEAAAGDVEDNSNTDASKERVGDGVIP